LEHLGGVHDWKRARKAGASSLMANETIALDADAKKKRVGIAVGGGGDYFKAIAAGFSLCPEFLAGTAVEGYVTGGKRPVEGFFIHEAEHENLAIVGILHNCRGKAIHFVEIDRHHPFILKTQNPLRFSRQRVGNVCV
jgi:hypothetical protein